MDICVDANCGYATPRDAVRIIRKMEQFRLKYAEQPVEGIDRLAEVARVLETPVMADESAWYARDVLEIFEKKAADIVSIYTTKPGGLYGAMEVAAAARAAKFLCNVNGSVETGVGNLANIHLAAAAIPASLSCVVPVSMPAESQNGNVGGIYYIDDLIAEPFVLADGCVVVPDGPGFGIDVDEAKIEKYLDTSLQ
jgi:muconate cycloisomerase